MESEEIWKTYPEFDFIQGSNLGRVKACDRYVSYKNGTRHFRKGHILPQQRDKRGYMAVDFSVNGKHVRKFVHQIVLSCFVNNPGNLPAVNHKDCNPANNCIDNLEWCNASYNNWYREKHGMSQGHPLWAFNLKTGEKLYFRSQNEAGRELEVNRRNIQGVLRGELNQTCGYWFTENRSEITKEKLQEIKNNMIFKGGVIAINWKMPEPLYFKSQMEARRQLGADGLYAVLKGERSHAKGYWFVYADDNATRKTKAKFGDAVANKVAKLMEMI